MFDKIKQKLHGDSDTATTQQPNKSTPSINEPSTSSGPSTRHQSEGSVEDQPGRLSVSEDRGRPSSNGLSQPRTASKSRSRSRARDVLWKSSFYDSSNPQGNTHKDPNLRAKSLSVAAPHPTMAEEDMKKMPYTDWTRKN